MITSAKIPIFPFREHVDSQDFVDSVVPLVTPVFRVLRVLPDRKAIKDPQDKRARPDKLEFLDLSAHLGRKETWGHRDPRYGV